MRRNISWWSALVSTLAGFPLVASADVAPPVEIRLEGPQRESAPGDPYSDWIVLTPGIAGEVTNLRLVGEGWSVVAFDAPASAVLQAGESLRIRFTAIPEDPETFLGVFGEIDGWGFAHYIDLSARSYAMSRGPGPARRSPIGDVPVFPAVERTLLYPAPEPRASGAPTAPQGPQEPRNIRVRGRFGYTRSDGQFLGGDAVAFYVYEDQSPSPPALLSSGATDAFGFYDVTFSWPSSIFEPDIYVEFLLGNSRISVLNPMLSAYRWRTGTTEDYAGADLNLGSFSPTTAGEDPAVHIHTNLVRTWRWLATRGYDCPAVWTIWPQGATGAFYNGLINIGVDRQWLEDTQAHEYGHHFIQHFAVNTPPDYCNGNCDTPTCGHCIWCAETDHDAFNEGMPNWLADVYTRQHTSDYGYAVMNGRSQESLANCGSMLDNPLTTEGFLGALLRDIEDAAQDDHPQYPTGIDALSLGEDEILATIDLDHPITPVDFLNEFKERYPEYCAALWQTAVNCGYQIDQFMPGPVTNLFSPSHDSCFLCADPTVDFSWTTAWDDCAGIQGYSVVLGPTPVFPDATMDIGPQNTFTTGILAAGNYHLSIRAVDWAGRWSPVYESHGPVTVTTPNPANVGWVNRFEWYSPVVPRLASDGNPGFMPSPLTLFGNVPSTWYNVAGYNFGDVPTASGFQGLLSVDAVPAHAVGIGPVTPFTEYFWMNAGPITVRGGRHTLGFVHDSNNDLAEPSETDNITGHQWVWTPLAMTPGSTTVRSAPPGRYDGWSAVVDGSPLYNNSDGLRFSNVSWWTAVGGHAASSAEDYDLRLHNASGSATGGFEAFTELAYGGYGAGFTDAVILNSNAMGWGTWDVGVENYSGGTSSARVAFVPNGDLVLGDSVVVSFAADEMVKLYEVYVGSPGWYGAAVQVLDSDQPVTVRWLDSSFTTGGFQNAAALGVAGPPSRRGRVDLLLYDWGTPPSIGYNCVVLSRDYKDGMGPISAALEVGPSVPDLMPYALSGWYSPFVPRPAPDGTLGSVPAPASLTGEASSTYFNIGVRNEGPVGAPAWFTRLYADGIYNWWIYWNPMNPASTSWFNWGTPWYFGGGRHVLSAVMDPTAEVEESDETDNVFGEQWVWTPGTMASGAAVNRGAPNDRIGGWQDVATGEPLLYNCDGLRTPSFAKSGVDGIGPDGWFSAVAILPGASTDLDLRLHEPSTGAKDGFAEPLAGSAWGAGRTEFVIVSHEASRYGAFDAGIVNAGGSEPYAAHVATAPYLGSAVSWQSPGVFSSFSDWEIIEVWRVLMPIGSWTVALDNESGTVDWGLSVHAMSVPYHTRNSAIQGGLAFLNGPGQGESATVTFTSNTQVCIAVWKTGASSSGLAGDYELRFVPELLDAGPVADATSPARLASVYPNPFGPSTTVAYEIDADGPVLLQVLNLHGELVRTLVDRTALPGRHEIFWDGQDEQGRPVASGIYLVQIAAQGAGDRRKVVLVR